MHEMLNTAAVEKGVPQAEQEEYAKDIIEQNNYFRKIKKKAMKKGWI